jgi:hypothetical protein
MNKLKVLALTVGDINVGSSRLRSHLILNVEEFFRTTRSYNFTYVLFSDVVHIQKIINVRVLLITLIAKILNKKIIFDIDDQASAYSSAIFKYKKNIIWLGFYFFCKLADIVTVDTNERLKYWSRYIDANKIHVIPDCMELIPDIDLNLSPNKFTKKNIVWCGNYDNYKSVEDILMDFELSGFNIEIITSPFGLNKIKEKTKYFNLTKWSQYEIFRADNQLKFTVLNHKCTESDLMKSENKMVTALLAGLIPIVSNTPAYVELAMRLNIPDIIFNEKSDIKKIINNMSYERATLIVSQSKKMIIDLYSNKVIANKLNNIIKRA